jgi:hypothetical protein
MLDGAELAHAVSRACGPDPATGLDEATARYESDMFARSGDLAVSSNEALLQFFATTDVPDLPPDPEQEHRDYLARAEAYRQERARRADEHTDA